MGGTLDSAVWSVIRCSPTTPTADTRSPRRSRSVHLRPGRAGCGAGARAAAAPARRPAPSAHRPAAGAAPRRRPRVSSGGCDDGRSRRGSYGSDCRSRCREQDDPSDSLPIEVDGLQKWAIGDSLLRDRLAGVDLETCRQLEWRRGRVPPARLGRRVLTRVLRSSRIWWLTAGPRAAAAAHTVEVVVPLPGTRQLRGTVSGVHGNTVVRVVSRLRPRDRLGAWVRLLALLAVAPEGEWSAVTIGRAGRTGVGTATVFAPGTGPRSPAGQLVGLYDAVCAHRCPSPRHRLQLRRAAARRRWTGGPGPEPPPRPNAGPQHVPGERERAARAGGGPGLTSRRFWRRRDSLPWPGESSWFGDGSAAVGSVAQHEQRGLPP